MASDPDLDVDSDLGRALREIADRSLTPSTDLVGRGVIVGVPELRMLAETPQDPQWHPEGDVLVHSLGAADIAATLFDGSALSPDRRSVVVLAALFHDIGKPDTTRYIDGRLTSRGHAERGAEIVRDLRRRLGLDIRIMKAVEAIVATHMAPASITGDPSRRAVAHLVDRLRASGTSLEEWAIVVHADGDARGSARRRDVSADWLRVARAHAIVTG